MKLWLICAGVLIVALSLTACGGGAAPAPTAAEKVVKLCYKRTAIQIDAALRRKPGLLNAVLTELTTLVLPKEHRELLWSYLRTDQPNDLVPLACVMSVSGQDSRAECIELIMPGTTQVYDPVVYRSGTRNGVTFSSNLPHRAPVLCYIAGIECPITSATVSYGVWKIPEAQVTMFPDTTLQRFGAQDSVPIVLFYLDEYIDPLRPTWRVPGGSVNGIAPAGDSKKNYFLEAKWQTSLNKSPVIFKNRSKPSSRRSASAMSVRYWRQATGLPESVDWRTSARRNWCSSRTA